MCKLFGMYVTLIGSVCAGVHIDNNFDLSYLYPLDNDVYLCRVDIGSVDIYENSEAVYQVEVLGAEVHSIETFQHTTTTISEGWSQDIRTHDQSIVHLFSSEALTLQGFDSSTINIYSGDYELLIAREWSTINIYGYDFMYELPEPGKEGSRGWVTGMWGDKMPFRISIMDTYGDLEFENPITFDHIVFHEIPEPGSVVLLGLGALMLRGRRRRRGD